MSQPSESQDFGEHIVFDFCSFVEAHSDVIPPEQRQLYSERKLGNWAITGSNVLLFDSFEAAVIEPGIVAQPDIVVHSLDLKIQEVTLLTLLTARSGRNHRGEQYIQGLSDNDNVVIIEPSFITYLLENLNQLESSGRLVRK